MRLFRMLVLASVWAGAPCAFAQVDGLEPYSKPAQLVELDDGRLMNLVCMGHGAPTVLIQSGWSSWSLDAAPIQAGIAKTTRVCAYDRAGLGFSSPPSKPPSLASVIADQTEMLAKAGIEGPFIVVGGSKGAVMVRSFTAARPDDVVGLVLVDPGSPERDAAFAALDPVAETEAFTEVDTLLVKCLERAKAGIFTIGEPQDAFCVNGGEEEWPQDLKAAFHALQHSVAFAETRLAEFHIANADLQATARGPGALGDRPLIVLQAGEGLSKAIPAQRRAALEAAKRSTADMLTTLSRRGERRMVEDARHDMSSSHPEAVIDAVTDVVAAVRSAR